MSHLFLATMSAWSLLLKSLVPLLMTTFGMCIAVFLLVSPRLRKKNRGWQMGLSLSLGNLLAAACWFLVYADTLLPWRHPAWNHGAPILSLACLLILPWLALRAWSIRRQCNLNDIELFSLRFSLLYQLVTLVPGLYLVVFYMVLYSGRA